MAKMLEASRFVDMRIECGYRYVHSGTEYFRMHTHDYCEIFIMTEGEAYHTVNGETVTLTVNDCVFVRPSDTHNYSPISGKPFSFLNLTFTKNTLDLIFDYLSDGYPRRTLMSARLSPTVHLSEGDAAFLDSSMESIRAIPPEAHGERKTALRVLLLKLFSDVFSAFTPSEAEMPDWLCSLVLQMQAASAFKEGISGMIELSGKSREHLTRSVRKYLGKTPSELVNQMRLNFIANMLRNSNHKVLDIIYEAGFNTPSYAHKLFLAEYGMSMSGYRNAGAGNKGK